MNITDVRIRKVNDEGKMKAVVSVTFDGQLALHDIKVINSKDKYFIVMPSRKNPDGKAAYMLRSYISTFIGQFLDNFIFSLIVFAGFAPIFWDGFCWTVLQCAMCALTGALAELVMEILFSPIGYRMVKKWKESNVGREYLEHKERSRS